MAREFTAAEMAKAGYGGRTSSGSERLTRRPDDVREGETRVQAKARQNREALEDGGFHDLGKPDEAGRRKPSREARAQGARYVELEAGSAALLQEDRRAFQDSVDQARRTAEYNEAANRQYLEDRKLDPSYQASKALLDSLYEDE